MSDQSREARNVALEVTSMTSVEAGCLCSLVSDHLSLSLSLSPLVVQVLAREMERSVA